MISVLVATAGSSSLAVGVAVVATLVVVALLGALVAVIRAARALRRAAEELSAHSAELLEQLGGTLAHAHAELERVDDLVGSAENLTETVGSASRAAYVTLANPLIKIMAFRRGTRRAAQRWRARSDLVQGAARHPGASGVPSRGSGRSSTAARRR
jgi:hypothetical protein